MDEFWEAKALLALPWENRRKALAREVLRYLPLILRLKSPGAAPFRLHALRAAITFIVACKTDQVGTLSACKSFAKEIEQLRSSNINRTGRQRLYSPDWTIARSTALSLLDALDTTNLSDKEQLKLAIDPYSFGSPRQTDIEFILEHKDADLFVRPLWYSASALRFGGYEFTVESIAKDSFGSLNGFWRRWYEEMWSGTFRDWPLAIEVATLPDELWEGEGAPAKVAEAIRKIEARRRMRVSTPLVRNEDDTAFEFAKETPLPEELLDFIKERVSGALRTALETGGSNGFDQSRPEALTISRALESANPSSVAGLLNDASLMFQKNLGDLYPEDGALIALQVAAYSAAEEICEIDETARRRCLRAAQLYLRESPPALDQNELEEFTSEIAAEAAGEAASIIQADGSAIASGRRVGKFILARFANYASTIVQWIDKTRKGTGRVEWMWKQVRRLMKFFEDQPPQP